MPEKDKTEQFAAWYTMVDTGDCRSPEAGKTTRSD